MNEYSVLWTAPARKDLKDIINYIAANNKINAFKILERIEEKVNQLKTLPKSGRIVPELKLFNLLTYHEIIESPWRIIYRIDKEKVYIITIIDGRRNLEDLLIKKALSN